QPRQHVYREVSHRIALALGVDGVDRADTNVTLLFVDPLFFRFGGALGEYFLNGLAFPRFVGSLAAFSHGHEPEHLGIVAVNTWRDVDEASAVETPVQIEPVIFAVD